MTSITPARASNLSMPLLLSLCLAYIRGMKATPLNITCSARFRASAHSRAHSRNHKPKNNMETTIEFEKTLWLGTARKFRAANIDEAYKFAKLFNGEVYYCFGWIVVI